MLVDTHIHLTDDAYLDILDEVIEEDNEENKVDNKEDDTIQE